jgi:hypothetical protein
VFVIRAYIDFLIFTFLSNSHSKFPTIWTIFFNSQSSAELEINVDVKYVGEDERTDGVGTVWGKWERGKDFGKWVTCGKY